MLDSQLFLYPQILSDREEILFYCVFETLLFLSQRVSQEEGVIQSPSQKNGIIYRNKNILHIWTGLQIATGI